jgi:hypothetical protein
MRNEYQPPRVDSSKLDFSQFHPLDHRPLTRRCREHYGGLRRHLWLLWEFHWEVPTRIKRISHCWLRNDHCWRPWYRGDGQGGMTYGGRHCCWCFEDMPESLPG